MTTHRIYKDPRVYQFKVCKIDRYLVRQLVTSYKQLNNMKLIEFNRKNFYYCLIKRQMTELNC